MALTSADETDLLLPLHDTTLGPERFEAFLARLRQRTRAAHAGLTVRTPSGAQTRFESGLNLAAEARHRGLPATIAHDRLPFDRLRPVRVYALAEFLDDDAERKAAYHAHLGAIGLVDERVVRISAADSLDAWLVIARGEPCTAGDSVLLSALVPHVALALRAHAAQEQTRLAMALADSGLARTGTGWIAFDRDGRVAALDRGAADWLERATGHRPRPGERLRGLDPKTDRQLLAAAAECAARADAPVRGLRLAGTPRIDAILGRADHFAPHLSQPPAMLALCRFPPGPPPHRAERLAELCAIPPREAELATCISEGLSLAEAADRMGLTVETARNYSKQLYAKLGVRGQAELVRLVCESGANLA